MSGWRPRLSANIGLLFPDLPLLDRIAAAARAGFRQVECHAPYEVSATQIAEALAAAGISMNSLNTAGGGAGAFGLAGVPGREAEFAALFEQALAYARTIGVPMIHVLAGVVPDEARAAGIETYVTNLRRAADEAPDRTLLLEPLNARDRPGYLVSRSDDVADLIARIDRPNVKLLFDVYHVQIMEGDLIRRLERHMPVIGHVQIAAVPSRAEPDEGEVAYPAILAALDALGYGGLVGAEYNPRGDTLAGLSWRETLGV